MLLGGLTLTTYGPVREYGYVNFDDPDYVFENPHVLNGVTPGNIVWAFSHFYSFNWHPVTWISHMLDCQLWGTNAGAHHLVNLALHVVNTLLVFILLKQMTGAIWRPALVAVFFALHPLHVESVAWITERKDVLSTFFWLLAIGAYYWYSLRPDRRRYLMALVCFGLGLLSKPMVVTLPFVLLLLDYWPLARLDISHGHLMWPNVRHLVSEKIPFIFLSVASCWVTFLAQQHGGALQSSEQFPFLLRLANALMSYVGYLNKLFWPTNLAVFYPFSKTVFLWWTIGAAMVLMGITALTIALIRRRPYLFVGWAWYVGTLIPVIGLVQVGEQSMADRYTYVPSIGVLIMVIWGMHDLILRWRYRVAGTTVISLSLIIICVGLTREQLKYWQNSETLFRHALDVSPDNYLAHYNLGCALDDDGGMDEAIFHYEKAIRSRPDYFPARYNLGIALIQRGPFDEAILQLQEAVRLKPDSSEARNNLGTAFGQEGRFDEAIPQFEQAIRLNPQNAKACCNYGLALVRKGRAEEAIFQFQNAIRLNPAMVSARSNLAMILAQKNQLDEAIGQCEEIIRLDPDNPEARNNLGALLMQNNRLDEAIVQLQTAIRINPAYAPAQTNLTIAMEMKRTNSR